MLNANEPLKKELSSLSSKTEPFSFIQDLLIFLGGKLSKRQLSLGKRTF